MIGKLLAVVAIVLGIAGEVFDVKMLLGTLEWFVLAIALVMAVDWDWRR
jgi:hypothetical protein